MYQLVRTWEDYKKHSPDINYDKLLFSDTETEALDGISDTSKATKGLYGGVRLVQVYQEEWECAVILDVRFLGLAHVLQLIKPAHIIFHNGAYDLHTINCATDEWWTPRDVDDTIYMSRIALFKKGPKFDYYSCLQHIKYQDSRIREWSKAHWQKYDWSGTLSDAALEYAALDVTALPALYNAVKEAKETESYQLDKVNMVYATEYSRRGVPVNQDTVREMLLDHTTKAERLEEELAPLNPNSSKQCCEALGTSSSDSDTLAIEANKGNKLATQIKDARHHLKTVGFLKKYDRPVLKGFFNPSAAVTGRWSCSGGARYGYDNRQQHPRQLLHCQEAPKGYKIIYKDYSGLELRLTVAWTGEPVMYQLMLNGEDIHTYTTCAIMGLTPDIMTKEQRTIGKQFTFASLYGAMEVMIQKILRQAGIFLEIKEIRTMRNNYFETYEYFKQWHTIHKDQMQTRGYMDVFTALGKPMRTTALTDSLAMPIQGSAAEVTKFSLALLKTRYPTENLVTTIHDANALVVREDVAEMWKDRLNECMVEAWYYVIKDLAIPDLPMPAEAEISQVWKFD